MFISMIYFFLLFLGLGSLIVRIFNLKIDNTVERLFMSIGIGLGIFSVIVSIMHVLHIPFNYLYFIPLMLGVYFLKDIKKFDYNKHDVIAIVLFLLMFCMMFYGSTKYAYLEDSDPWGHALSAKYISIEKNALTPEGFYFHYLEPYPISYSVLMGVLHQTNDSIKTTLKFFNSLLIGLVIILFYYFAKRFTRNKNVALLSTFILFSVPSFMSHFIWSQSLAIPLMIVAFYCMTRINGKQWELVGGVMMAGVLLTQPSTAVVFTIMVLIFYMCKIILENEKRFFITIKILVSGVVCIVVAGIYWGAMFFKYGWGGMLEGIGLHENTLGSGDTSGGIIYKLMDFIIAPLSTKIDQPVGLGIFVGFLLIIFLIFIVIYFKKYMKIESFLITFVWLIFSFLGVMGNALPFKLFPHRFWVFFSIPVAIMVSEFIYAIFTLIKTKNKFMSYFFVGFIIVGILLTSAYPKYIVNTANWPPGPHIIGASEIRGVYNLDTLPRNTKVFNYFFERDLIMVGMDLMSVEWSSEVINFRKTLINSTFDQVYDFLKENEYEYLYISGAAFRNGAYWYGENATTIHISEFLNSLSLNTNKCIKVYETQGTLLYMVI